MFQVTLVAGVDGRPQYLRHPASTRMPATRPVCPRLRALVLDSSAATQPAQLPSAPSVEQAAGSTTLVVNSTSSHAPAVAATPAGSVTAVHGPDEMASILAEHADKLVIVMCKARGCRPCKAFARKYARLADQYSDSVFVEITGDESSSTRRMMIDWSIRSTPTFLYFRNGALLGQHTGINEDKFKTAVGAHLQSNEQGYGMAPAAEDPPIATA